MNVLEINGNFKFIFHLSDIHIRLNSRKEEYEFVFEELYQTLKKCPQIKDSLIVITGDLLHNKIDLTVGDADQITSGAREMIFMNFLSRNSRATGPKIRVPRGLLSLSMMTMAFESKRR